MTAVPSSNLDAGRMVSVVGITAIFSFAKYFTK